MTNLPRRFDWMKMNIDERLHVLEASQAVPVEEMMNYAGRYEQLRQDRDRIDALPEMTEVDPRARGQIQLALEILHEDINRCKYRLEHEWGGRVVFVRVPAQNIARDKAPSLGPDGLTRSQRRRRNRVKGNEESVAKAPEQRRVAPKPGATKAAKKAGPAKPVAKPATKPAPKKEEKKDVVAENSEAVEKMEDAEEK